MASPIAEAYNAMSVGKKLKLDFSCRSDAVGFRSMLSVYNERNYEEFVTFEVLKEKPTIKTKIEEDKETGIFWLHMEFVEKKKEKREFNFIIVED